jgi:four helix bundle suffix protein
MAVRGVPRKYKVDQSSHLGGMTDMTDQQRWQLYSPWLENENPAVRANSLICLIHQANYLLDQQIAALEENFVKDGGYSEQLATERLAERNRKKNSRNVSDKSNAGKIPVCPKCGKSMVLRTAKSGKNAGQSFWGCSAYPDCKGVVTV